MHIDYYHLNQPIWEYLKKIIIPVVLCLCFCAALFLQMHGYFLFIIVGACLFAVSLSLGKEIYLVIIFPIVLISESLSGSLFFLDYYNRNGLNPLKIHPFTVAWLTIFCLELIYSLATKRKIIMDKVVFSGLLVIALFSSVTLMLRGVDGMPLAVENYIGPISFMLYFYSLYHARENKFKKFVVIFLFLSVVIGIYGIVEYIQGFNFLDRVYSTIPSMWIKGISEESYRIKTVLGHPLTNAMVFLTAMILTKIFVNKIWLKYALLMFFTILIVLTGSRSILLISLFVYFEDFLLKVLRKKPGFKRDFVFTLLTFIVLVTVILTTSFGNTLIERIEHGEYSTWTRIIIIEYFLDNMELLSIRGLGGSEAIKILNNNNEIVIMENPWIILWFEMGVLMVAYLAFLYFTWIKTNYKFLIFVFVLALSTNNSFGVKGSSNWMLYFVFSACLICTGSNELLDNCSATMHGGLLYRDDEV